VKKTNTTDIIWKDKDLINKIKTVLVAKTNEYLPGRLATAYTSDSTNLKMWVL